MILRPVSNAELIECQPAGQANWQWLRPGIVAPMVVVVGLLLATGCGDDSAKPENGELKPEPSGQSEERPILRCVELGEFRIRETRPLENLKLDLRFDVQMAVSDANKARLERIAESRLHALRNQVITAVRTAESPEFDEPELKRVRRRMMLRIVTILDDPIVDDIFLTNFHLQVD